MKHSLLYKEYRAEELADIGRDVHEAFNEAITPNAAKMTADEYGMIKGKVRVSITYCTEDDCDCTGFRHQYSCRHFKGCD